MCKKLLFLFLVVLSQIETGVCDDKGVLLPYPSQSSNFQIKADPTGSNNFGQELQQRKRSFSDKVVNDLTRPFDSKKFLLTLGPGVTGGGVGCAQNIAYSFEFLRDLIKKNKIKIAIEGKSNPELLTKINNTVLSFGDNLEKSGKPVDALNIPLDSRIIIDRKTCDYPISSLHFFTPLLLHEVLSLMLIKDESYQVSRKYVDIIIKEIATKTSIGSFYLTVKESDLIKVLIWKIE